jgi:3-hydroxyacyl-CoA dehydrogenase
MQLLQEVGQSPVLIKKEVDSFIVNRLQGKFFFLIISDANKVLY